MEGEKNNIKTDIPEIETCISCGNPDKDIYQGRCDPCYNKHMEKKKAFLAERNVISKLIYSDVSKSDFKILHEIINNSVDYKEPDAYFKINQSELAKDLFVKQSNISRSIKKLTAAKYLIKNGDEYTISLSL